MTKKKKKKVELDTISLFHFYKLEEEVQTAIKWLLCELSTPEQFNDKIKRACDIFVKAVETTKDVDKK